MHNTAGTVPKLSLLLLMTGAVVLLTIFIPYPSVDCILLALALLVVGHIYLQEKLLLALLLIRPTIDYFRDITILHVQETAINVNAALSMIVFLWAMLMFIRHRAALQTIPFKLPIILLCAVIGGSVIYSVAPGTTAIEAMKFFNLMALFLLSWIFVKTKTITLPQFTTTIVLSAIVPIAFGLLQLVTNSGIATLEIRDRIYGTFAHPNVFAFFLLFLLTLLIQYSIIAPTAWWQKERGMRTITFVFLFALLLMTYTRAALIGLLIFLLTLGMLSYRKFLLRCIVTVAGFYLLFYPLNQFLIANYNYSLADLPIVARLTTRSDEADSISWRMALVQETIPIMAMRPVHGYGFGTFPIVWDAQRGFTHLFDDSAESHNDYLRFMLETGVIGLLLYLLFLMYLLLMAWQRCECSVEEKQHNLYLIGILMIFIATSLSDNMLHHTPVMWLLWSYLGAALAVPQLKCKSPNLLE